MNTPSLEQETAESQQVQRNKGIIMLKGQSFININIASEIERCIMHCTWGVIITQEFDFMADHAPSNSHQLVIVHCRDISVTVLCTRDAGAPLIVH